MPKRYSPRRELIRLKKIKTGFRKAVDSGRNSGGGRVVWNMYDECCELWSGSPAVQCLNHGLETESVIELDNTVSSVIDITSEFTATATNESRYTKNW